MGKLKEYYFVWQLSEQLGSIEVVCQKCEYQGRVMTQGLPERTQEKPVNELRFKCTRCGSKETLAKPTI